jgi:Ni,Fe-hydrogenase III large subunit/Ni,Fe-hydrogenase III component G
MSDVISITDIIREQFPNRQTSFEVRRNNELHLRITDGDILPLAELVCTSLGAKLMTMIANDRRNDQGLFEVTYLYGNDSEDWYVHATTSVGMEDLSLPSLATFWYPASRFERAIQDSFGIDFVGHPLPRPLVKHVFWPDDYYPLRKDAVEPQTFENDGKEFPFLPVGGEGVYEIPVGPVHAGIIEPGHFRFSVVGETIIDLTIRLSFTHKGTEKLFEGKLPSEGVQLAERISGDTSVGHALAYCQALEALAGVSGPARAEYLRVTLLEMERLYNHVADFGMIANDTGFAVANSHCSRIKERLLRLNKQLTGNRLLRGGLTPGGVTYDIPVSLKLETELDTLLADFEEVVEFTLGNGTVMNRLKSTGRLTKQTAEDHGVLGYVARASGLGADVRKNHPFAAYAHLEFTVPVYEDGDVWARAMVRVEEFRQSVQLIKQALSKLPGGPLSVAIGTLPAFQPAFGLVEGWRGAILHWLMTDNDGKLYRVKVQDPSFVNWPAIEFAVLKNIVPDFPLCNKSFNQSYSGNDL